MLYPSTLAVKVLFVLFQHIFKVRIGVIADRRLLMRNVDGTVARPIRRSAWQGVLELRVRGPV